nr:PLP-dependent aminotransferase family protein [uncultured Pedobacter sp.]
MRSYKFEEFTSTIERNIIEGTFKPGHKLPSIRELKEQYKTSTSTIQNGYEHLIIKGLVQSIPKSGYYVSNKLTQPQQSKQTKNTPLVRDAVFENNLNLITSINPGSKLSEFNVAAPGSLIIPQKLLLRTMQQVIREQGVGLLKYYPSNGSLSLREHISIRAATYQTAINPAELIITDGALQALYIALASVCTTGDIIAIESPCVFSVLEVIRVLKLRVIEIPIDSHTGFDIDYLKKACTGSPIKAILVTPNFQNPTGILLADIQKKELLQIAQHYNIAIIENDVYGDLNFSGYRPCTIKSFDESGLVITYSSYSKTLSPGIRLGWLSTGKFFRQAEQIKFSLGSTVSPIYQETVNKLIQMGSYDRHIRKFRTQLAKNAYHILNLLSTSYPEGTIVFTPAGGYNIWAKLSERIDIKTFYNECERIGVRFTPGHTFSFSDTYSRFFRIVFADQLSPKRIEVLKQLGQMMK